MDDALTQLIQARMDELGLVGRGGQAEAARRCGMSEQSYSNAWHGPRTPKVPQRDKIARGLGIPLVDIEHAAAIRAGFRLA